MGEWSLPGGLQELGETAEAAARRELAEETGLHVGPLHLAGHVDSIHLSDDGRVRYHFTILDFCAAWAGGEPAAGDDASAVIWAGLHRLDDFALWSQAVRIIKLSQAILKGR